MNICFSLLHFKSVQIGEWNIFLILSKYNGMQIQLVQHWYSKCNSNKNLPKLRGMGDQI